MVVKTISRGEFPKRLISVSPSLPGPPFGLVLGHDDRDIKK